MTLQILFNHSRVSTIQNISAIELRINTVITYGGKSVSDKNIVLINDSISKIEKEAEEDAGEKAYFDEEMVVRLGRDGHDAPRTDLISFRRLHFFMTGFAP